MLFLGLGLLELAFVSAFFLLLIVGVTFDRRGKEDVKWWVFGLGLLVLAVWQWPHWTFIGPAHVDAVLEGGKEVSKAADRTVIWNAVRDWSFWAPVGYYLLGGLVYSLLEFFLDVRRSARFYAAEWQKHLVGYDEIPQVDADGKPVPNPDYKDDGPFASNRHNGKFLTRQRPNSEVYEEVRAKGATSGLFNTALKLTSEFVGRYSFRNRIIEIKIASDKVSVEPRVNKVELSEHITAWTLLWPAYAVSLILGDLVVEIFNALADLLVKISGQFVRISFANVFKF
jgi:hypothetical protein